MTDLYSVLGIDKTAAKDAIRKAFRRKAKTAHPDAGGSRASFDLVCLAADILGDDARRARYDATGETDEQRTAAQQEGHALQTAFQAIEAVIAEVERRGMDPLSIDLIADAIRTLNLKLAEIAEAERKAKRTLAAARKLVKKFRAKKGKVDMITPMMNAKVAQFEQHILNVVVDRPVIQRAIAILGDHSFSYESAFGGGIYEPTPMVRVSFT